MELAKGRYITALNRILRFHNLSLIQFSDIIETKMGTSSTVLYHQKALSSTSIETFQALWGCSKILGEELRSLLMGCLAFVA
jgi:hypothetical protein